MAIISTVNRKDGSTVVATVLVTAGEDTHTILSYDPTTDTLTAPQVGGVDFLSEEQLNALRARLTELLTLAPLTSTPDYLLGPLLFVGDLSGNVSPQCSYTGGVYLYQLTGFVDNVPSYVFAVVPHSRISPYTPTPV